MQKVTAITVGMLVLLLAATPILAQGKPDTLAAYRNRLLGVFDVASGEPVEGAQVTDVLNKTSALTTRTGTVGLFFLPEEGGIVRITKVGYAPQTLTVGISPADTSPITVMFNHVNELPAVVSLAEAPNYVSPMLREFEERRHSGFGRFISEAELRKHDDMRLGDVLRRLAGLEIVPSGRSDFVTTSRSAAGNGMTLSPGRCRSVIYVDGVNLGATELRQLPDVITLGGVEWYASPAELPSLYNATGSACGVLLLWTRER